MIRLGKAGMMFGLAIAVAACSGKSADDVSGEAGGQSVEQASANAPASDAAAGGGGGLADASTDLGCVSCHEMEFRKVGPSFKEVAEKLHDTPDAATLLAKRIREGGSGTWGSAMMPPQAQVSEEQAQQLAKDILALKK